MIGENYKYRLPAKYEQMDARIDRAQKKWIRLNYVAS
jgi:hypothetical protein